MGDAWSQATTAWIAVAGLLAVAGLALAWRRRAAPTTPASAPARSADAQRDPLTGLMTRAAFEVALQNGLATAEKTGSDSCVLYVGLEGFRIAQDGAGAAASEQLLAAAAQRLQSVCGASTPICRVAGEEFAVWLNAPREAGEKLARHLCEAFVQPIDLAGRDVWLGPSVGLALVPEHGSNLRVVGKAAAATYSVQRSGGGGHALFDPRIEAEQSEEVTIARELQQAILKKQLELFYQPKIDAGTLQVTAVEALLRWRHPTLGLVSPSRFIPIAERQGLIEPIGAWVLEQAIKQAASWRTAGMRLRVAVNISGLQFRQDDFAAKLGRMLKTHGLPPDGLSCEITETVAAENTEATRRAFMTLEQLGVQVSIDDFSASPPAMAAMRQLHLHELKIERAALAGCVRDAQARKLLENAVKAAHSHKLRVVAAGVETVAQRDLAVHLGCDELQGYLFAKPMSARAVIIWAADAPASLAQTFRPTAFKDTQPLDALATQAAFAETRISLQRSRL
ncbi:MAG TPA: phosphodiesterase [Piscinibacter sp.]|nr:phosphodiesterase [Piscinibacter sp.]